MTCIKLVHIFLCSGRPPEDGNPMQKHVGVGCLSWIVFTINILCYFVEWVFLFIYWK